jgi:hypothetical protein
MHGWIKDIAPTIIAVRAQMSNPGLSRFIPSIARHLRAPLLPLNALLSDAQRPAQSLGL